MAVIAVRHQQTFLMAAQTWSLYLMTAWYLIVR